MYLYYNYPSSPSKPTLLVIIPFFPGPSTKGGRGGTFLLSVCWTYWHQVYLEVYLFTYPWPWPLLLGSDKYLTDVQSPQVIAWAHPLEQRVWSDLAVTTY